MIPRLLTTLLAFILTVCSVNAQTNPCGSVKISNSDSLSICLGDEVALRQTNTLTGAIFRWSPVDGLIDLPTDPTPRIRPQFSGYYKVTATGTDGCTSSDSIYIDVDVLVVPEIIRDTTVCQGSDLSLVQNPVDDAGNTIYTVLAGNVTLTTPSPENDFTVTVQKETTYTIVARSENGACEERQRVRVRVIDGYLDIPQDTVFACLGVDSIVLTAIDTPFAANREIVWSPVRFNLSPPRGRTYTVRPVADITYYAETTINGCRRIDSVAVRLDSLPTDLSLRLEPEKDPYCQGDTFYVLSPVYDAGDFPLIEHNWISSPGLQSPRELYNAVFVGQDTALLQRVTRNGACTDTSSIQVNVVEPPIVTFDPPNPIICPDDPLQITATFQTGAGSLKWIDPTGTLSCTDCLDPVATVSNSTTYTVELVTDGNDCTTDLSYTIQVVPNLEPTLTTATLLCPGDTRQLIVDNVVPSYTYRITGGGIDSSDPSVQVTPTETTTYTIETTGDCGTTTQTIQLVLADDYTVTASGASTVCAGEPLTLRADVSLSGINGTFTWSLPNGISRTGQEITVTNPVTGTYTVVFRDELGCTSATGQTTVEVLGEDIDPIIIATLPDGTTIGSGDSFFAGNELQLAVTNLPGGQQFTYSWVGSYSAGTLTGQTITVGVPRSDDAPQPLVYTVTVTSEDGQCTFDATIFLEVQQSRVEIPDFFSPNADGRNDRFRMFFNGNVTDYTMLVYDRWGQKVFTSDDPLEGWDGTKNGTPQPADVYLYLARFRQDGVELQEEGQVSLVR
ncbi:T9SS type B sorting domain-containing protein [Neolewinella litorea]|nr:gliding motility-associated C-terminal domain-containing protein [Neolewinella litorea]